MQNILVPKKSKSFTFYPGLSAFGYHLFELSILYQTIMADKCTSTCIKEFMSALSKDNRHSDIIYQVSEINYKLSSMIYFRF